MIFVKGIKPENERRNWKNRLEEFEISKNEIKFSDEKGPEL